MRPRATAQQVAKGVGSHTGQRDDADDTTIVNESTPFQLNHEALFGDEHTFSETSRARPKAIVTNKSVEWNAHAFVTFFPRRDIAMLGLDTNIEHQETPASGEPSTIASSSSSPNMCDGSGMPSFMCIVEGSHGRETLNTFTPHHDRWVCSANGCAHDGSDDDDDDCEAPRKKLRNIPTHSSIPHHNPSLHLGPPP